VRLGRRPLLLLIAVVVVAVLVAGGLLVRSRLSSSDFEDAMGKLPAGAKRASFTDWAAVRDSVPGGSSLSARSSADDFRTFLDKAFDKDLTAVSALSDSFEGLAANYGITPLDAEWEAYGQAEDGSVDVVKLDSEVDLSALEDRFQKMGYQAPADGPGSGGVWQGTPELVVGLKSPLLDLQQNVAVVADQRLLMMSDDADYLKRSLAVVSGDSDSLTSVDNVPALVDAAGNTTVAELWAGDFACSDLAMSQADPSDVSDAESMVAKAGGVHPLSGLVMAQQPDLSLVVGMAFESSDEASADLQPRTDLASGAAPGQGGTFSDRFRIEDSVADGNLVKMTFKPVKGPLLNDLGEGPVLFATC